MFDVLVMRCKALCKALLLVVAYLTDLVRQDVGKWRGRMGRVQGIGLEQEECDGK